ncbi:transposase [Lentisphaera profundi]|uniref:Transposase n=1 Tax=Lentisphaera profundi TaxID=1658616 RepID=A0ABY7W3N9_9BACT|nr:transposase [Lentisphaera profundi]WDE98878.1 transposase [Lentisphaera profundi]
MKRKEFEDARNWHRRGFIPHYDASDKYQMVTYRLADSLPIDALKLGAPHSNADEMTKKRKADLSPLGAPHSNADEMTKKRKLTENFLDQSHGSCLLQTPKVAQKQIEAWEYFNGERYELIAYVVMPNHVHLLIKTYPSWPLSQLVASWKKHVTYFVQKDKDLWQQYRESYLQDRKAFLNYKSTLGENESDLKNRTKPSALECGAPSSKIYLWQNEYWDRFIRNENHFQNAIHYILENPVKAGLVNSEGKWPWSAVL